MKFSDAVEQFIELRTPVVQPSTLQRMYRPALRSWLSIIEDKELESCTKMDVQRFVHSLLSLSSPPRSRTTVNTYLRALKSFARWWSSMDVLLPTHALCTIRLLHVDRKAVEWISVEEFRRVLAVESSALHRAVYTVGILTGLRLSTLCALRWSWVDSERRTLSIQNSSTFRSKNGRAQCIPLSVLVLSILDRQPRVHECIFVQRRGCRPQPLRPQSVSHAFKRAVRKAGLPQEVHFHTLRKSFGSLLLRQGVPIESVSTLLGHSSISVTVEHYAALKGSELHSQVSLLSI